VSESLLHDVVVGLGVERDVRGAGRNFVEEDSSDSGVLRGVGVNVFLHVRDGPCTIRGINIPNHFHAGSLKLVHIGGIAGVGARGRAAVGVDDSNGSYFCCSCCDGVPS